MTDWFPTSALTVNNTSRELVEMQYTQTHTQLTKKGRVVCVELVVAMCRVCFVLYELISEGVEDESAYSP